MTAPPRKTSTPAEPEDGAALLDAVEAHHRRFNVFPSEAAYVAVVLWDAHAHLLDAFESTPRVAFLSPEPGSGKSRALEVIETLVPQPMNTVSATTAAIFRSVGDQAARPTILFDEIDTVFGPKAKGDEELRGLLNAGHRRSGVSYRCVGDGASQTVQGFPSFAAVAFGGLGHLPDTLAARSVLIHMRRKARTEHVTPFRARIHKPEGHALRDRLARWADEIREQLTDVWPEMPDGVTDRPADVWEPLLAVADAAGGHWPDRARRACLELVNAAKTTDKGSIGIQLLTDLRDIVFRGADRLPTAVILERLHAMEDAEWADIDGKPLDARGLSKMLGQYVTTDNKPIKARNIRIANQVVKGFHGDDLADAWARYCPHPPGKSATSATSATPQVTALKLVAAAPENAATASATSTTGTAVG